MNFIEMWQIFHLYTQWKLSENLVGTRNYCHLSGNRDVRIILTAKL